MTRLVALLRAINTPPRHVKMANLRAIFVDLGLENVATFIASGNVIFDDPEVVGLADQIEATLERELGFEVATFLRTGAEVCVVADRDPFSGAVGDVEVSFLRSTPDPTAAAALVSTASGTDQLGVFDREVYWLHEVPRSESPHREARVIKTLGMETTQRSLRTVTRLADKFLR